MRALQIAATGMSAQQTRVEVISNNLANMSPPATTPAARNSRTCITSRPPAPVP